MDQKRDRQVERRGDDQESAPAEETERSPEERSRIQQASGFHTDNQQLPLSGERAQDEGGTVAATPPTSSLPPDEQKRPKAAER